jgi:hypothetical protein
MKRLIMVTLWPAFLVAIIAEGFFFSVFDPHDTCLVGSRIEMTPIEAYTIGFICFWVFCSLASMLTCYLISVPNEKANDGRSLL